MNRTMERDHSIKIMLVAVMVYYILATVLAVAFLDANGRLHSRANENVRDSENLMVQEVTGEEVIGEALSNERKEEIADLEEDIAEKARALSEQEIVVEDVTEEEEALPAEAEPEPEPEPEKEYYSFVSSNVQTGLNMRTGPDIHSEIIYKLKPGTSGVVVELGDEWSLVAADGHEGYCDNEFLTMKRITEEEYNELTSEF